MFKKSVADFRNASGESKLTIESGKLFHNLIVAEKKLNLCMHVCRQYNLPTYVHAGNYIVTPHYTLDIS